MPVPPDIRRRQNSIMLYAGAALLKTSSSAYQMVGAILLLSSPPYGDSEKLYEGEDGKVPTRSAQSQSICFSGTCESTCVQSSCHKGKENCSQTISFGIQHHKRLTPSRLPKVMAGGRPRRTPLIGVSWLPTYMIPTATDQHVHSLELEGPGYSV